MQARYQDFRAKGAEVVAISSSAVEDHRKVADRKGIAFPILADPEGEAIRAYGLLHLGALPSAAGQPFARPAEFLVDPAGKIAWRLLTDNWRIRARPETLLEALKN